MADLIYNGQCVSNTAIVSFVETFYLQVIFIYFFLLSFQIKADAVDLEYVEQINT